MYNLGGFHLVSAREERYAHKCFLLQVVWYVFPCDCKLFSLFQSSGMFLDYNNKCSSFCETSQSCKLFWSTLVTVVSPFLSLSGEHLFILKYSIYFLHPLDSLFCSSSHFLQRSFQWNLLTNSSRPILN